MQIKHSSDRLEISTQLIDNSIWSWLESLWYVIAHPDPNGIDPTIVHYHGSDSLYPERAAPNSYTIKLIFDGPSKRFSCLDRGTVIECPFDQITGVDVTEKNGSVNLQIRVGSRARSFNLGRGNEPEQAKRIEKLARSVIETSRPGS